jgi:mono/diheme cytochrome c family protein
MILAAVMCALTGLAPVTSAQETPEANAQGRVRVAPASEPPQQAVIARGQLAFTQNCAFCHGADAHGGAEGGVDLTLSTIVMSDPTAAQLATFLKVGRPPRMPSFTNLTDAQVSDIAAFVRSKAPPARGAGLREAKVEIVGDPIAGQQFFNGEGKCDTCHSATGDLKGIGAKYSVSTLQGRIVLPRGTGLYPGISFGSQPNVPPDLPRTVTVREPNGKITSGKLVSISDFDVTLRDTNGVHHTFDRNGDVPIVVVKDPLQAHLDLLPKLTNKEMHDLTAYLVTLK